MEHRVILGGDLMSISARFALPGKTVLLTGAAGGIGAAVARHRGDRMHALLRSVEAGAPVESSEAEQPLA